MTQIQGRRLPDLAKLIDFPHITMDDYRNGDYWKVINYPGYDRPVWMIYYYGAASIGNHKVIEHDDGTISVPQPGPGEPANSIALSGRENWHGFIDHGVWEPC